MSENDEKIPEPSLAELTALVRQQLDDATAVVIRQSVHPLEGGFSGASVDRFHGQARTATGERSWSLVRKMVSAPNGGQAVTDEDYWKREILFYQSPLPQTLPITLVPPCCLGITEPSAHQCWLWQEDVGAQEEEQWPLAAYGMAARHLGQFNGAYLMGCALPDYQWLRQPDLRQRLAAAEAGISELPALRHHPLFAPLLATDHLARIERLWHARKGLLARLEALPQSFCHRDAFQRNLLLRQDKQGETETVALDWGSCGLGMLGEELVPLFAATLKFILADTDRLADMDQAIFAGYMAGLRDIGWQGDERLVRFGFTALAALKVGVAEPATKLPNIARRVAALPPAVEPPQLLNPGGYEQVAAVDRYLLDLGEEATELLDVI